VAIIKAEDFAEVQNGNLTPYEVKKYGRKILDEKPIAQLDLLFEEPKTVPLVEHELLKQQLKQKENERKQQEDQYNELKGKLDFLNESRIHAEESYNRIKSKMRFYEDSRIEAEAQRIMANRELATVRGELLLLKNASQGSNQELKKYLETINELKAKLAATEKGVALLRETNETLRLENDRLTKELEELKANSEESAETVSSIEIPEASKEKQKHRVHFLKVDGSRQRVDVIQPV
jgi:chromosome segregation ATPase